MHDLPACLFEQREINAEYFYVVEGFVISNGKLLESDRGYIAEPNTVHSGFRSRLY